MFGWVHKFKASHILYFLHVFLFDSTYANIANIGYLHPLNGDKGHIGDKLFLNEYYLREILAPMQHLEFLWEKCPLLRTGVTGGQWPFVAFNIIGLH